MHKKTRKNTIFAVLILTPSFLGVSIFYIIPFIRMCVTSFFTSGINGKFIGIQNYENVIKNESFILAFNNSIIFLFIAVPLLLILSLLLSLTLGKTLYYKESITAAMIFPMIIPVAIVSGFFGTLFKNEGLINQILHLINITPIDWEYGSMRRFVILIIYIWKNMGYNVILLLAGLSVIPKEYYEVADLDGGSALSKFRYITFIYLMPTFFFVAIISIIGSFKVFKETFAMDGAYPNQVLYMMQHYINNLFSKAAYSKFVTAAIIFTVVIGILVLLFFKFQKFILKKIEG